MNYKGNVFFTGKDENVPNNDGGDDCFCVINSDDDDVMTMTSLWW